MKKSTIRPDAGQSAAQSGRPDFEAALQRLEEIVERLDDGNLPLADSLALFKEGTQLAKICRTLLTDAELQVQTALQDGQADADERVSDQTLAHDHDPSDRDR